METKKKWLIFWGILAALFVGMFAIVLSGNFPQFTIPFSVFASNDKEEKQEEIPKLKSLALKDVNDQTLLEEQTDKIAALNTAFSDNSNFSSSQSMATAIEKVYGPAKKSKNLFDFYRKIYPMVSSEENGFVSVSLLGFGQRLINDQTYTSQRQIWSFTDSNGTRHDYTISLQFNTKELYQLSIEENSEVKSVITKDDTYLDKSADFETAWTELVQRGTDVQLYRQMKKDGMNSDQTEFKALEKSMNVTDPSGFFDLFRDTRGDLTHAYLSGFYHTNTPTDGQSDYYFRVPTSEKGVAEFIVVYDRLQQKILSINKQDLSENSDE
ncbi:hypothetical protein [Enterococcus hermanniensis]|uniref:Uncharacterized protein n=1 Tax=Enterococcus hermanniensis TaxID=249189 RepID=A0A1L8TLJ6_9ENTE|nr:hypothetical protein [Enterococcus hermanniensis]OJG45219.1 hypothetical protein RV04_GL002267 [Enterococcus hermanniensis]